jgi:RNA polymerase sigma-70 factor (ECF subfamily)
MYSVTMLESPQQQRFHSAYQANYARILGYALRRTASPEDAADVVAETFAIAWRKFDDIPPGDDAVLWLYGVARRVLANHHRRQASGSAVLEMLVRDYEEAVAVAPLLSAGGISPAFVAAWQALRPGDRDLLGLLVWETLTTEQIASVVGCPRAVVKVRIHRARRRFAKELERRGIESPGVRRISEPARGTPVKPPTLTKHIQVGRAAALPDMEV